MALPLAITVSEHPAASVVAVTGELDIATGEELRRTIKNLVRRGRTRLVVDVSQLRFCDSHGLEALLDARAAAEQAGGAIRLAGVHGVLQLVLDLTGTRQRFAIDETPIEGVAALLIMPAPDISMV